MAHPKTEGMIAAKQKQSRQIQQRCNDIIDTLLREAATITFSAIAKRADVSATYLYKQEQLKERINAIKEDQEGVRLRLLVDRPESRGLTEASKDVVIAAQAKRIKEYEATIKRQAREIDDLRAKSIADI